MRVIILALVSGLGCDAVAHVDVSIPAGGEPVLVPTECSVVPGESGFAADLFVVRYYVDGGILVEVHYEWLSVFTSDPISGV